MAASPKPDESLSGIVKILIVVVVVCLGLWGCARKPNQAANAERVNALETKCQKLEQDYRAIAQAREKARKDLAALEEEGERLRGQLGSATAEREVLKKLVAERNGERDDLRQQLAQKTVERDSLATRCERFRKGVQQLLISDANPAPQGPTLSLPNATSAVTPGS